jgi:hypothetical protein
MADQINRSDIKDDGQSDDHGKRDQAYDERELQPGGVGKQGDQQQMGQDREPRKDKSDQPEEGSDKLHADERGEQ